MRTKNIWTGDELGAVLRLCSPQANVARVRGLEWPPEAEVPRQGIGLCVSDRGERPVTIGWNDIFQHGHVVGPTSSGKTWLLTGMFLDIAEQRRLSGTFVDCKDGGAVELALERIPREDWNRVVLIEPSHPTHSVGINLLEVADPAQRDLMADLVVSIFHQLFAREWGRRAATVLRHALVTLMRRKGSTLVDLAALLTDEQARKRLTRGLDDPWLKEFWRQFEDLGESGQREWTGSVTWKLRDLLLSPMVRCLLGQGQNTVSLTKVLNDRGILLINLPPGLVGDETSALLGALLMARIWQVVQGRASIRDEAERPGGVLFLDEFQRVLSWVSSVQDMLAEARSMRQGLVLAHQHLGQLTNEAKAALRANARTKAVFQPGDEDEAKEEAKAFPGIDPQHVLSLQRRQVLCRVAVQGRGSAPFTGYTRALRDSSQEPEAVDRRRAHAEELRVHSLERYGRPKDEVEEELRARHADLTAREVDGGPDRW